MAADPSSPPPGGVGASNPPRRSLPVLIAPTTQGTGFNAISPSIVPLACWRLEDLRFEFDSSIIKPDASAELTHLAVLWQGLEGAPASVFGHADPVGDDEYNKALSGRRAAAVYGLLTRDVALWDRLYSQPFGADNWQHGALTMMGTHTGMSPYGPRQALFLAYMDAICRDAGNQPFVMSKQDFLGRGADPGGKADLQGCSEFNAILLFSKAEDQALAQNKPERNRQNQPNRRVMVFLFPPGLSIDPARWPCPRWTEGSAGCRAHFWPDGDQRRAFGERRREYQKDKDTFACAFYDGMARRSPCEIVRKVLRIRLLDSSGAPVADGVYKLSVGNHDVRRGTAKTIDGGPGWLEEADVMAPSRVKVEYGRPVDVKDDRFPYLIEIAVEVDGDDEEAHIRRLHNLGYHPGDRGGAPGGGLDDSIEHFQRDYAIEPVSRRLDAPTRARLIAAHDNAEPPPPKGSAAT